MRSCSARCMARGDRKTDRACQPRRVCVSILRLLRVLTAEMAKTRRQDFQREEFAMSRLVKCGMIQASCPPIPDGPGRVRAIQESMEAKHIPFIEKAGKAGVQILGLQEVFNAPYFCPAQTPEWCDTA